MKVKREIRSSLRSDKLKGSDVSGVMKAAHVVPREGSWVVVKAGPKRTRRVFPNKRAALLFAKSITSESLAQIVVHSEDRQDPGGKKSREVAASTSAN